MLRINSSTGCVIAVWSAVGNELSRLHVASAARTVTFEPDAIEQVHLYSGGIPRLINLICDRSLLGAFAAQTTRIDADIVNAAAEGLDLQVAPRVRTGWFGRFRRSAV